MTSKPHSQGACWYEHMNQSINQRHEFDAQVTERLHEVAGVLPEDVDLFITQSLRQESD